MLMLLSGIRAACSQAPSCQPPCVCMYVHASPMAFGEARQTHLPVSLLLNILISWFRFNYFPCQIVTIQSVSLLTHVWIMSPWFAFFIPSLCTCTPRRLWRSLTVAAVRLQRRHGIANMCNLAGFLGFLWKGFSGIAWFNILAGCLPHTRDESLSLVHDTFSTPALLCCLPTVTEMYLRGSRGFQNDFWRN